MHYRYWTLCATSTGLDALLELDCRTGSVLRSSNYSYWTKYVTATGRNALPLLDLMRYWYWTVEQGLYVLRSQGRYYRAITGILPLFYHRTRVEHVTTLLQLCCWQLTANVRIIAFDFSPITCLSLSLCRYCGLHDSHALKFNLCRIDPCTGPDTCLLVFHTSILVSNLLRLAFVLGIDFYEIVYLKEAF